MRSERMLGTGSSVLRMITTPRVSTWQVSTWQVGTWQIGTRLPSSPPLPLAGWLAILLLAGLLGAGLLGAGPLGARSAFAQTFDPTQVVDPAVLKLQQTVIKVVAQAEQSVVAIAVVPKGNRQGEVSPAAGSRIITPESPQFVPVQYATGVVWDRQGHIVTNWHVLGDPSKFTYWVWKSGRPYRVEQVRGVRPTSPPAGNNAAATSTAKPGTETAGTETARTGVPRTGGARTGQVIAGDPWTDLAVLKVSGGKWAPIQKAQVYQQGLRPPAVVPEIPRVRIRRGQFALCLGNPLAIARDGNPSVGWGMVANVLRAGGKIPAGLDQPPQATQLSQYPTLLQTDIRLHQGMSGGALLDLQGRLIGLTTTIVPLAGFDGNAGYAIPVDRIFHRTISQLVAGKQPDFGYLGLAPRERTGAQRRQGKTGAVVSYILAGTPAEHAGLKLGDVITHVDQVPIVGPEQLFREIGQRFANDLIELQVQRAGGQTTSLRRLQVRLSARYVAGFRFGRATYSEWRGLRFHQPTTLPPTQFRKVGHLVDRRGCVAVVSIRPQSPAAMAGLKVGDLITHLNGQRLRDPAHLQQLLSSNPTSVKFSLAGTPARQIEL